LALLVVFAFWRTREIPPPSTVSLHPLKTRKPSLYEICDEVLTVVKPDDSVRFAEQSGTFKDLFIQTKPGTLPIVLSVPHGGGTRDSTYADQKRRLKPRSTSENDDFDSLQT